MNTPTQTPEPVPLWLLPDKPFWWRRKQLEKEAGRIAQEIIRKALMWHTGESKVAHLGRYRDAVGEAARAKEELYAKWASQVAWLEWGGKPPREEEKEVAG